MHERHEAITAYPGVDHLLTPAQAKNFFQPKKLLLFQESSIKDNRKCDD